MKLKMKMKLVIDCLMTVLLLLLMAYQVTGDELHEWFDAGMLLLFIVHTILNIRWYANLFKGSYRPVRIFGTVLNVSVLVAILSLGYSGIVMSRRILRSSFRRIHGFQTMCSMCTRMTLPLQGVMW